MWLLTDLLITVEKCPLSFDDTLFLFLLVFCLSHFLLLSISYVSTCVCVCMCVSLSCSRSRGKPRERDFLKTLRLVSAADACTVERHGRDHDDDDDDEDKGVGVDMCPPAPSVTGLM